MFGPLVTTEARLACARARIHSNNKLNFRVLLRRSPFWDRVAQSLVTRILAFSMIQNMLLVFVWVQSTLARACITWTLLPTVIAESSVQARVNHAPCPRSCGKAWK